MWIIGFWLLCSVIAIVWLYYDINKYQATVEDVYEDGEVEKIYRYKDKKGDWVTVYKLKSTRGE